MTEFKLDTNEIKGKFPFTKIVLDKFFELTETQPKDLLNWFNEICYFYSNRDNPCLFHPYAGQWHLFGADSKDEKEVFIRPYCKDIFFITIFDNGFTIFDVWNLAKKETWYANFLIQEFKKIY